MKPPVEVAHLFPEIDRLLLDLLRSLLNEQWQLPTLARQWKVKDVAAHLLDGNVRVIAESENFDGFTPPEIRSYSELVSYLNEINADWVKAMKRVSPGVLIEMLEATGKSYSKIMGEAPLFEPAKYPVAWAGENTSLNWFHIAREYTEKVHHQLQIRHAVGEEATLLEDRLFFPFIDTLLYGIPHQLKNMKADAVGDLVITISGEVNKTWAWSNISGAWIRVAASSANPVSTITIEPTIAWKLFTKAIRPNDELESIKIYGDKELANTALNMIAVMA